MDSRIIKRLSMAALKRRSPMEVGDAFRQRVAELAMHALHAAGGAVVMALEGGPHVDGAAGLGRMPDPVWLECCRHHDGTASLLVIPDLWATALPDEAKSTNVRFLAAAPIPGPAGEVQGLVCVLDTLPRHCLSAHHGALLRGLAELVLENIERRQQTFELAFTRWHVVQVEGILHDVQTAVDWRSALEAVLRRLCRDHNAAKGQIWKRQNDHSGEDSVVLVSSTEPGPSFAEPWLRALKDDLLRLDAGANPVIVRRTAPGNDTLKTLAAEALVLQPIELETGKFWMTLSFDNASEDLDAVAANLPTLAEALNSALYRKSSERKLALLTAALNAAQDVILVAESEPLDRPGPIVVWANNAWETVSGYRLDDVIGQSPRFLQGPATDQDPCQHIGRQLRKGEHVRAELLNYRKDGETFWVELDITPIIDHDRKLTHWVSIQRDVTQRHEEIMRQERRQASIQYIFEKNPLPMWVFDPTTLKFLDVNPAACRFYGWTRDEFMTMNLEDIRPEAEFGHLHSAISAGMLNLPDRIWTHLRRDKTEVSIKSALQPVSFQGQDAVLATAVDVTDMERTRAELRQNNATLLQLTAQLQERTDELAATQRLARLGSWRIAVDRETMDCSEEMLVILELEQSPSAHTWSKMLTVVHPEDRDHLANEMSGVFLAKKVKRVEFRLSPNNTGTRFCRLEGRPIIDETGLVQGAFGFLQDITELKDAEFAMLRSERLKSLGQLTGGVAHDFNNILTVTRLNLEEAVSALPSADPLQEVLQPALHAALLGGELTSRLLSFARRAPLRPKPIKLDAFFRELAPLLTRSIGEKFKLVVTIEEGAAGPTADPAQLENALVNLVINSRDAMADGGLITVTAGCRDVRMEELGLESELQAGVYAVIAVTDTGHGIPAEIVNQVFEPFFTTKAPHHGSGLGLSMVYGFARQSGGCVAIRSTTDPALATRGTTVSIYLPASNETDVAERVQDTEASHWTAQGLRALVVEDQAAVLGTVSRILRQIGFVVTFARDATEAIAILERDDDYDLMFSDVVLPPPMDGVALATEARRIAPHLCIVLTSGYADDRLTAMRLPDFDEFIAKPYGREDLRRLLAKHLPGGQPGTIG